MSEISERFPALTSDDFVGGTYGPSDGSVDTAAVVDGYRRKAKADGATSISSTAVSIEMDGDEVSGVRLADDSTLGADAVVVCAGAWSTELLATVGVHIPVEPVMRTVYVVSGDVEGGDAIPSFFLPSGVYVLHEQPGTFLMGWSTEDDPVGFDFTPSPRAKFYDQIWPELATRLPAFDRLEVVRSWAGLYAQNRLDANAIIGEWPGIGGLFQATGFSGHGFQQCHAVGRHLAELICDHSPSIDLGRLGPERIVAGEPLFEHPGRII
jgi:glycine/D-amino acid oxidase-like deaminating enzyme